MYFTAAWGISKNIFRRIAKALLLLCCMLYGESALAVVANQRAAGQAGKDYSPARYVDPFIGTGTGSGGATNCFPGASMPFGMVQLSPDTESTGAGYHYYQTDIQGFSMTHMSGAGAPSAGDIFFTATTGAVHTQIQNFQSSYSHKLESASPGYYQVVLQRWGIQVNLHRDSSRMRRFRPACVRANPLAQFGLLSGSQFCINPATTIFTIPDSSGLEWFAELHHKVNRISLPVAAKTVICHLARYLMVIEQPNLRPSGLIKSVADRYQHIGPLARWKHEARQAAAIR